MSATHTPGPWNADEKLDANGDICIWDGGSDWAVAVATEKEHREEVRANARLIAAAPDLLAACERIVKGECTCADGGKGFVCDVCEAKAAVAKAKGT